MSFNSSPNDNEIQSEGVRCLLCPGDEIRRLYPSLPKVLRCENCGLVFLHPQPDIAFLKQHYGEKYFTSRSSVEVGYDNYLRDEENIKRSFRRRLKAIERYFEKPGKLLDVGCAAGFFLAVARERGWDPHGVEISDFAASYAQKQGFDVLKGTLEEYPATAASFDLVTLWDVLEHLKDPKESLKRIHSLLKPGGHLVLTTPAIDSWTNRIFRDKWMGFKDLEHLFFFSRETLKGLLVQCGFKVCSVRFEGKYVSMDLFKRRLAYYWKGSEKLLEKLLPSGKSSSSDLYVNPFDIQRVIAQRP
jgi:SAM-dependent methyltransferase